QMAAGSAMALAALLVFVVTLGTLNLRLNSALAGAHRSRQLAQEHLYVSDIRLANAAWNSGDVRQFDELMSRHIPTNTQGDTRGLEWHYLWNRARVDQEVICRSATSLYSVCFSPDGELMALTGADGVIRFHHGVSGTELFHIDSGQGEVNGAAFSPDGQFLASAGDDGTVCLWQIQNRSAHVRIRAHDKQAYAVVFIDGGRIVASCGNEPVIRLWDSNDGHELGTLAGHASSVETLNADDNGQTLVSGDDDGILILWDLLQHRPSRWLRGHDARICCLAVSADGQWFVSGSQDRTVRYWHCVNGEQRKIAEHNDAIQSLCLLPGEKHVAVGDRSGLLSIHAIDHAESTSEATFAAEWEAIRGSTSRRWRFGENEIRWCGYHATTGDVIVATWNQVLLRNLHTGTVRELELANPANLQNSQQQRDAVRRPPAPFDVSANGKIFVCVNEIYQADPQSPSSWRQLAILPEDNQRICQVAVSPDGKILAYNRDDGRLFIWRVASEEAPRELTVNGTELARNLEFSPQSDVLAVACSDNQIRLYDIKSATLVRQLAGHQDVVNQVVFVSSEQLVSCSDDQTLRLWDIPAGQMIREYRGHVGPVRDLAISQDGQWLMSQSTEPGSCRRIWELQSGRSVAAVTTFPKPLDPVAIEFLPTDTRTGRTFGLRADRDLVDLYEVLLPGNGLDVQQVAVTLHRGRLYGLGAAANQQLIAVGQDGRAVRVNCFASGTRRVLSQSALDFAPWKQSRVIVASGERELLELDAAEAAYSRRLESPNQFWRYVGTSTRGAWIAASSEEGQIASFDATGRSDHIVWPSHKDNLIASPSGRYALLADFGAGMVSLFDMKAARVGKKWKQETGGRCAVVSTDERTLFSEWQNTVNAWDIASGSKLYALAGHTEGVHSMATDSDGRWLATGGGDRAAIIWDLELHRPAHVLTGHRDTVKAICFSPDGRTLFTGDYSGVVKAWHVSTGRELLQLDNTGSQIKKMGITEDGSWLVCLFGNRELFAYHVAAGRDQLEPHWQQRDGK
ncbi:MAG: WD40 repeat domain-containing protein, partial [Planctomycetales bacterium]|nr:WD40 repeat domain-containing protein [Planctomycetales bacterium]